MRGRWAGAALAWTGAALLLAGCSAVKVGAGSAPGKGAQWVLLPMMNYSVTPRAGEKVEAVLATALRAEGARIATRPPGKMAETLAEMDDRARFEEALEWARRSGFQYGVTGSVEEYRYKIGLDGEPVVGITVQVIDVKTGETLWSASGSRSGWGRGALSAAALELVQDIVDKMEIE